MCLCASLFVVCLSCDNTNYSVYITQHLTFLMFLLVMARQFTLNSSRWTVKVRCSIREDETNKQTNIYTDCSSLWPDYTCGLPLIPMLALKLCNGTSFDHILLELSIRNKETRSNIVFRLTTGHCSKLYVPIENSKFQLGLAISVEAL